MISRSLPILRRALTAGALGLALVSCKSTNPPGPGGQIVKVKYYHLVNREQVYPGANEAVNFERQHYLYGAISNKERDLRDGHYYVVMWSATDRTQPVKVRLEYRQQKTGTKIKTLEKDVTKIERRNDTEFEVNGEGYATDGPVTSWRATLVRGKQVLAEAKSYLWD
jgi:hypothetical protein